MMLADPILRAPLLGAVFMCLAASLIGVIAYIRRRSLVSETLSHATYPGIVLGASFAMFDVSMLLGALATALVALWLVHKMQTKLSSDASLCAVLVAFLGLGVLLASHLQFADPKLYTKVQVFLYGQSATLVDAHVIMYAVLAGAMALFLTLLFHPLRAVNFDRTFAHSVGLPIQWVDAITMVLLASAVVIGIRSVGVVLISGMLVAPAIAARKLTHRLSTMFVIAGVIGVICGFGGTYLSIAFRLPTGPLIVLLSAFICVLTMLLAKDQGLIARGFRIWTFRRQCKIENVLKSLWKSGKNDVQGIRMHLGMRPMACRVVLGRLMRQGWCERAGSQYTLTRDGKRRASHIVRLHRLWEVYLTSQLGQAADKVHCSAEEMEHILSPDFEIRLIELLKNPKKDPHAQPIPKKENF